MQKLEEPDRESSPWPDQSTWEVALFEKSAAGVGIVAIFECSMLVRVEVDTAYSENVMSCAVTWVQKRILHHHIGKYCFGAFAIRRSTFPLIRRQSGSLVDGELGFPVCLLVLVLQVDIVTQSEGLSGNSLGHFFTCSMIGVTVSMQPIT